MVSWVIHSMRKVILAAALMLPAFLQSAEVQIIGGQLRQSQENPSKWCWIVDRYHTTIGVNEKLCGTAKGNKIFLPYGVSYSKVISFNGLADDDYVNHLDMHIGVSKGISHSVLSVTSFGQHVDVDVWLGYAYGNIEINGIMVK